MTLYDELSWRGFVNQTTLADPTQINVPRTFYLGVDPSADSMTIGNLAAVMVVKHLVKAGHKAIVLVGGATGMIGDPKDDAERELKALDEINHNKAGIARQYQQILQGAEFELVDNYDWFKDMGYLEFLRLIGKEFSMTQLLDREFVQARIGEGTSGISYAEFSYSLIQGYDFLHLYREKGVTLQIGGSDQWGNMLSGVPLIRRLADGEAHVWTIPLIINRATGKKFGKSEGGAIWLDEKRTSVYQFYQFWLNADDLGVNDYLKVYTLLPRDEIERLSNQVATQPEAREAQKVLAREVTSLVHGPDKAALVARVTETVFGRGDARQLSREELELLSAELPTASAGSIIDILINSGVATSNGEARRLITGNAISVNGERVSDLIDVTAPALVKKGKNSFVLVR